MFKKAKDWIDSDPKTLFLVDGLGAILSAFLLGVVLVRLENIFGIPSSTLYLLAFLPCLFAFFDFYCYRRIAVNLDVFLKRIAYINIGYCFISVALACYHFQRITYLGWIYVVLEVIIVLALANFELGVAKELRSRKQVT